MRLGLLSVNASEVLWSRDETPWYSEGSGFLNEPIFAANISSFGQVDDSERRGRDAHVPPRETQRLALMTKDEGHKISIHVLPPLFCLIRLGGNVMGRFFTSIRRLPRTGFPALRGLVRRLAFISCRAEGSMAGATPCRNSQGGRMKQWRVGAVHFGS